MADTVNWPDNTGLIEALEEGQCLNDTHFRPFFLALFHSRLIVPQNPEAQPDVSGHVHFSPLVISLEEKNTLLAFTDRNSFLKAFPQGGGLGIYLAREICQKSFQSGIAQIALNINGPAGFLLRSFEIQAIGEGQIPIGPNKLEVIVPTKTQMGRLEDELEPATKRALQEICVQNGVREMWWFGIAIDGGQPHHALALSPATPEMRALIGPQIDAAWRKYQTPNAPSQALRFDLFGLDQMRPSPSEGERIFPE